MCSSDLLHVARPRYVIHRASDHNGIRGIEIRADAGKRGANLAKRMKSEVEVGRLIRAAPRRVLLPQMLSAGHCCPS